MQCLNFCKPPVNFHFSLKQIHIYSQTFLNIFHNIIEEEYKIYSNIILFSYKPLKFYYFLTLHDILQYETFF
jgi:hypothetical protein